MASHLPVNHHMRGFWRVLSTLAGLYVLIFGIVGAVQTNGMATFDTHGERVLGLTTNPAFSIISIVAGALIVLSSLVGRNVDVVVNLVLAVLFVLAGLFSLAFLRTDLNYLAFSVTNCVVSYVLAVIVGMSSLFGRVRRGAPERPATHAAA
ncbi:MAG TPA: DUF4383 domain-containing protein [Actinocatenispora sp.]